MRVVLALLVAGMSSFAASQDTFTERVDFSGFARVVGGIINDEAVSYIGYDDSLSFSEQSLFALQADVDFTEKFALGVQALAHSDNNRDSGIEWAYLNFKPTGNWSIKGGRLRTPFVTYSDVIDVGFAYTWITAPPTVYTNYLFTNYEGISVSYERMIQAFNVDIEAYYGNDDNAVRVANFQVPIDIEDIRGIVFKANRGNFNLRIAYHEAGSVESSGDLEGLQDLALLQSALRGLGFNQSAESLNIDGSVDALHLGLRYDNLSYFAEFEWLRLQSEVVIGPQRLTGYYGTIGKNFSPFQIQLTLGRSTSTPPQAVNEIPLGVAPQLDALAIQYNTVFDTIPTNDIDYVSGGLRWDFRSNMALKGEVSWIDERNPSQFFSTDQGFPDTFGGSTLLFQMALEWVF